MSSRKKLRSNYSDDIFIWQVKNYKKTTVGDKYNYKPVPDKFNDIEGGLFNKNASTYSEKDHSAYIGLPFLVGGVWGPNWKGHGHLIPGNLVVTQYVSHSPYGPSGCIRLGVIWKKMQKLQRYIRTGYSSLRIDTTFFIRTVKKDLTLGAVFDQYTYDCEHYVKKDEKGIIDLQLDNRTDILLSMQKEQEILDLYNVYKNYKDLEKRLIKAGIRKKNM